jgi:VanZ family protein
VSLFTTNRERRLWTWTLVVVVAIYSTLGLAPSLSGVLRDRGLLDAVFVFCLLLVGAAIVTQALKTRPSIAEIGLASGIVGVYIMVFARMAIPEERTHLFEYSLVAALIYQALSERRIQGRSVPAPAALAVAATALLGWLDEEIQSTLPNRVYDLQDVGFNALAGLMAIIATLMMAWARRRVRSRSP